MHFVVSTPVDFFEGCQTLAQQEPCPAGSWCSAGQAIPCGEGLFNNLTGQDNMGACKRCPEAAVSPEASTGMRNCSCNKDYYDSEPDDDLVSCKPCTAGSSCVPGTTTATLNISVGWYRSTAASVDLRRCPDGSKENSGCIGGIGDEGPCKPCAASPLHKPQACQKQQDPDLLLLRAAGG